VPGGPEISVVIPTRDRHDSLRRTIAALAGQRTDRAFEVVVVDDGSTPPVTAADLAGVADARVVRGPGRRAAAARNAGIGAARGAVVLFTDDDTEPAPGWLEAAATFLAAHPGHVGVEGVVESPPWDPLYAYSITSDGPGAYLTCNIAFRREALERLGGFDAEAFPFHCEDVDLAMRAERLGPIGFAPEMRILHHPRELTLAQAVRRGRMTATEINLFRRHRQRFGRAARLPAPLFPLVAGTAHVTQLARRAGLRSPRRLLRFAAYAGGYLANVVAAVALSARRAGRAG
jgi:GT2 family glycosyltransferase